ncbi:hypothetical protein KY326_02390 [Candidatus Woesearchaeota archaeon]|nr:hypothetical protein [Candidatus Woesearchaeota archaeon]
MKPKPYIGVTGLRTKEDVFGLASAFYELGCDRSRYTGMFGFSASFKRLDQNSIEQRTELASHVPRWAIPMMHYWDTDSENFFERLNRLYTATGMYERNYCRAVQLNIAWPALSEVEKVMQTFPEMKIVLQFPPHATKGMTIEQIAEKANSYDPFVSYALIDPSRGKGIDFGGHELEMLCKVAEAMPTTRMGIAGGLGPDNVEDKIHKTVQQFKEDFCIDAQGKLKENKKFIMQRAIDYIKNAASILF